MIHSSILFDHIQRQRGDHAQAIGSLQETNATLRSMMADVARESQALVKIDADAITALEKSIAYWKERATTAETRTDKLIAENLNPSPPINSDGLALLRTLLHERERLSEVVEVAGDHYRVGYYWFEQEGGFLKVMVAVAWVDGQFVWAKIEERWQPTGSALHILVHERLKAFPERMEATKADLIRRITKLKA